MTIRTVRCHNDRVSVCPVTSLGIDPSATLMMVCSLGVRKCDALLRTRCRRSQVSRFAIRKVPSILMFLKRIGGTADTCLEVI